MTQALANYAVHAANSRGRQFAESAPQMRDDFQRDRDRIIHSRAFRRLEYKTQVFVNHEGDLFRTRLTHSLEVAQITRATARAMGLNEDLAEAIALAHDLGHTPFGHAGQDALNLCMKEFGGFEHNLQSLRTVDVLEENYADFDGLNLMFETREGILKHCSLANAQTLGELGLRFINKQRPSLEAQLANVCDEIAYNNHDIDDGLRSGLLRMEQLLELPVFADAHATVMRRWPTLSGRRVIYVTVREIVNRMVLDLIEHTKEQLRVRNIVTLDDVRHAPELVGYSDALNEQKKQLKTFLRKNLYQHYQVLRMTNKARRIISDLFVAFNEDPKILPEQYQQRCLAGDAQTTAKTVADYIAGMTDRYAMREHKRLFAVGEIF